MWGFNFPGFVGCHAQICRWNQQGVVFTSVRRCQPHSRGASQIQSSRRGMAGERNCMHPPHSVLRASWPTSLQRHPLHPPTHAAVCLCTWSLQSKLNETIARIQSVHDGHDDEDPGSMARRDTGERRPTVDAGLVPRHFEELVRVVGCVKVALLFNALCARTRVAEQCV